MVAGARFVQYPIEHTDGIGPKAFHFDGRIFLIECFNQRVVMFGGHAAIENHRPFVFHRIDAGGVELVARG